MRARIFKFKCTRAPFVFIQSLVSSAAKRIILEARIAKDYYFKFHSLKWFWRAFIGKGKN